MATHATDPGLSLFTTTQLFFFSWRKCPLAKLPTTTLLDYRHTDHNTNSLAGGMKQTVHRPL